MAAPIITFLSDFGHDDWFVGVVHGVLHAVCPEAAVVDLAHAIPPGDVARGGFVLSAAAPDFPLGTVHLGVVDPGVGTDRRAIAVKARGQFFVGPDNGLLEWAVSDPEAEVRSLIESRYFRSLVSRTFHGRDVFAPVAGHLARGEPIAGFGPQVSDAVRLPLPTPERRDGELIGRVVFIDRFGNALTNVAEQDLTDGFPMVPRDRLEVRMLGRTIRGLSGSYGEAPVGTILAIVGSSGRLEIAQVGGDASERLGLGEGDQIRVRAS
jgi:S-adenosylmethionine hydrolase